MVEGNWLFLIPCSAPSLLQCFPSCITLSRLPSLFLSLPPPLLHHTSPSLTLLLSHSPFLPPGVPHFVQEPQDVSTLPGVPFNLSCSAVGPPDPVQVLWWVGGVQEEAGPRASPSVLQIPGQQGELCVCVCKGLSPCVCSLEIIDWLQIDCYWLLVAVDQLLVVNEWLITGWFVRCVFVWLLHPPFSPPGVNSSVKFYCEAQNARGISVSRTATVHIKSQLLLASVFLAVSWC